MNRAARRRNERRGDPASPPKPPRTLGSRGAWLLLVLVLIGGAVQLALTYTHADRLSGTGNVMGLGGWGYFRVFSEPLLQNFVDGRVITKPYNQWQQICFGAGLAAFLLLMCQHSARWPIHPVALLFVGNWYAHRIWFSVLLGWGIKIVVLKYGGARIYRVSRKLFLGFMIGEVASVVCWAVVAAIVAARGGEYQVVRILPF